MGLDMYLAAKKYVSGWSHHKDPAFDPICAALSITPSPDAPSLTVSINVGYWRKANAIHKWFVDNTQDGVDDCRSSFVSREQLEELRSLCARALVAGGSKPGLVTTGTTYAPGKLPEVTRVEGQVVANPEAAADILPTERGFFFGSTDYDEGYIQDLNDTIKIIDNCLTNPAFDGCAFEYRASW